jgi:hypothetical protein
VAAQGGHPQHKTEQEEFRLTWEEIIRAIRAGKLKCREQSLHGNPASASPARGGSAGEGKARHSYLKDRQAMTELARINRELKRLKGQVAAWQERKSNMIAGPGK